jgi:hypothetical protein
MPEGVMKAAEREIRFGVVAVQKGFAKAEEVVEALELQVRENLATGRHRPIGVLMVERGSLRPSQAKEVLDILKKEAPR